MKVLIGGYYGFGNLGDEALLEGLIRGLEGRGFEPRVLSNDPVATEAAHGVGAYRRLLGAPRALLAADAFVSGGGGLLQDTTSRRSLDYYLSLIRAARLLGKRTVVFAQSVGPLSDRGRRAVAATLRGLPVSVRDRASQDLLAGLGVSSRLVADTALLLSPPTTVPAGDAPLLLIPRAGHPELGDALLAAGRTAGATGMPLAALALHPEQDRAEAERLRCGLRGLTLWRADDPHQALEHIAAARFVISARLHGLILATVANRGFGGLVYDPKVEGFLEAARAPGFSPPIDTAALGRLAVEQPPLPQGARAALLARADRGLDWLASTLRGS